MRRTIVFASMLQLFFRPIRVVAVCIESLPKSPLSSCQNQFSIVVAGFPYQTMQVMMDPKDNCKVVAGQENTVVDVQARSFVSVKSYSMLSVG